MNAARSLLAAATLACLGCGAPDPAASSEITLRPGVVLVHASKKAIQYETSGGTVQGAFFWTNDVSITDGRILLSGADAHWSHSLGMLPSVDPYCGCPLSGSGAAGTGGGSQLLYVSTDAGKSWVAKPVALADPAEHVMTTRGLGVAEWQGHAAALVPQVRSDFDLPFVHRIASFDSQQARFGPPIELFPVWAIPTWSRSGSRLAYGYRDAGNYPELGVYDMATASFTRLTIAENADARCVASYYRLIGDSFYAVCLQLQGTTAVAQCLQKVPSQPAIPGTPFVNGQLLGCVPVGDLDPHLGLANSDADLKVGANSRSRDFDLLLSGPFLSLAYDTAAGRVALSQRRLDTGELVATLDLGPGFLWKRSAHKRLEWAGAHEQFPGIVPIADAKSGKQVAVRFVMIATPGKTASGKPALVSPPVELVVPPPCGASSPCTYDVVAIQPVDEARLLVVYDIRQEHQYTAVTTIPNPTYVAPPTVVPGEPTPAGPLERQCARLRSCFPTAPQARFGSCLSHWSRIRGYPDHAYEAFLATPAASCAAFAATDPGALALTDPCVPGCHGDMALLCDDTDGHGYVVDCRKQGLACSEDPATGAPSCSSPSPCQAGGPSGSWSCDGARVCHKGEVVMDCAALGTTCQQDAKGQTACVLASAPCEEGCAADIDHVSCLNGAVTLGAEDCGRVGLSCVGAGADGRCGVAGSVLGCQEDGGEVRCSGDALTWCLRGALRAVDCKELGLSRCVDPKGGAAEATCVP